MSPDLRDQLDEYFTYVEEIQPSVDPREVLDSGSGSARTSQRRSGLGWVAVSVAAAAVVIVLVGVIALPDRPDGNIAVATDDADQVIDADERAQEAVVPDTIDDQERAEDGDVDDTTLSEWTLSASWEPAVGLWEGKPPHWITGYPTGGFVASGRGVLPRYSTDGIVWSEEPFDPALRGFDDIYIDGTFAVANFDPGHAELNDSSQPWVGRGWIGSWETLLEFGDDGWQVVPLEGRPSEAPVVSGNLTLINFFEHYLLSVDGEPFTEHSHPFGIAGLFNQPEYFAMPDEGFGTYLETGRLWISPDGENWTETPAFGEFGLRGPRVMTFEVLGQEIINQRTNREWAWISSDGLNWTRFDQPSGSQESIRTLHDAPSGLVLAERHGTFADDGLGSDAMWGSADGRTWTPIPLPEVPDQVSRSMISVVEDLIFYAYDDEGEVGIWMGALHPAAADPASFAPPLTFVQVDSPGLGETAWFNGRLYAATWQGQLLSTEDGVNWVDEDLLLVDADGLEPLLLRTDGESVVVGAMPSPTAIGSVPCGEPGDVVTVQVLDSTGVWTTSEIELPFTRSPSLTGCLTFWLSDVQVGPDGFIVAGSISGEVPFEAIIAQELGQQVLDEINGMAQEGNVLVVESGDGARTDRIDLDAIGLADDIADFGVYAQSVIESDEGDAIWFGERPFVWWSPDGLTWSLVDRTGLPMLDHQIQSVTPVDDGFILTSDFGETAQLSGGSVWEPAGSAAQDIRTWRGQQVVVDVNGVRLLNEPQTVLVQAEDIVGRDVELGDLGAMTFERIGTFGSLDLSSQPMHFSLDGSTWESWNPDEFSAIDKEARFIAIGDDFVIFEVGLRDQVLLVGTL